MKKGSAIMFAGTGSDVGKSIITAGFCRIFLQDGYTPAPFKAQNMSSNSFVNEAGMEMSRAQVVQAEAAGLSCTTDMNPLVLKPSTDQVCQVILNGKAIGNQSAYEYFRKEGRTVLKEAVNAAFDRLAQSYTPVVMEGAGSISEINLRETDLVNLPMAMHAKAPVILVADIDRGGVFASVYGSIMLLTPEERQHVKGILINKFRGDLRLFKSGITMLESLCQIPVVGVLPYFRDIYIDEEDSLQLSRNTLADRHGKVSIAVVLLQHMANFTDVNALETDPRIHLYYSQDCNEITEADIIIIPGSNNPLVDLHLLRKKGIVQGLMEARKQGKTIIGLGSGLYMMGQSLTSASQNNEEARSVPGLGLFAVTTELEPASQTRHISFIFKNRTEENSGYLIQSGQIHPEEDKITPLNMLTDGNPEGLWLDQKCFATEIHGLFEHPALIDYLIEPHTKAKRSDPFDFAAFKNQQYDKLAQHIRQHVDIEKIYKIINDGVA